MRLGPPEAFEYIFVHVTDPIFGDPLGKATLRVHGKARCKGRTCCIHNPSLHHMIAWPQYWEANNGIMGRICRHGFGHPDPDDVLVKAALVPVEEHECDGCCRLGEDTVDQVHESLEQMKRGEGKVLVRPERKTTPPSPDELQ